MKAYQGLSAMVAAIGCAIAPPPANAQSTVSRPDSAGRLVRSFDFNTHHPTPLPIAEWYRGQSAPSQSRERPGFPVWNGAILDFQSPAFEGAGSLMLPTQGGSTSVKLKRGIVPIFASADYLVTAMVRTQGLTHAGAFLEAWQVDDAGREIQGTRSRSKVIRSASAWTPVGVELLAQDADAAFVQIELLLLQPKALAQPEASPKLFEIWDEDFSGAAWFDSVAVHQLPRIELSTPHPGNVIWAPQLPTLEVVVRDLAGESLRVDLTLLDLWGQQVDSHTTTLTSGRLKEQWQPNIDKLGWYRGVIRLTSDSGDMVGGTRCDLLWLRRTPATPLPALASALDGFAHPATAHRGFGLSFASLPQALIPALPQLTAASGADSVTIPVWPDNATPNNHHARVNLLAPAIERLLTQGLNVTLGFHRLTPQLAQAVGVEPTSPMSLLSKDLDLWRAITEPYLDRFGQRVQRWQIGHPGDNGPNAAPLLTLTQQELGRLVPGPTLTIPWSSDQLFPQSLLKPGIRLSMLLVDGADDQSLGLLAQDWAQAIEQAAADLPTESLDNAPLPRDLPQLELALKPIPAEPFGLAAGVSDLIKRAVLAHKHFARFGAQSSAQRAAGQFGAPVTLTLVDPVSYSGALRSRVSPTPALGAWGQLVNRLADREIVAEVHLIDGVRCFMLEPRPGIPDSRGGALILWQENSQAPNPTLDLYLGPGDVRVIDMFGNAHSPARIDIGPSQQPAHHIPITSEPVYIEGVDTKLVRFLTSARLDPDLVEANNAVHEHHLVIDNPWPTPIRGRAFILEPGGFTLPARTVDRRWNISPRVIDFSIPAHGSARLPLTSELSAGTPAGHTPFVLDFELVAAQDYGLVRVQRSIELGLKDLDLDVYSRVGSLDHPTDVFLEARVTNNSDRTMNLELAAVVPSFPRGKAFISGLKPGESIIRSFPFPKSYSQLQGLQAAISLTEPDSASGIRLIKAVTID